MTAEKWGGGWYDCEYCEFQGRMNFLHEVGREVGSASICQWREAASRGRRGDGKLVFNGCGVSIWEADKVLEIDGGEGCTTL